MALITGHCDVGHVAKAVRDGQFEAVLFPSRFEQCNFLHIDSLWRHKDNSRAFWVRVGPIPPRLRT